MSAITAWWRSREENLDDVWPFMLVAAVLYLFRLGAAPLWYDEAATALFAQIPLAKMIIGTASDTHPPLYYLLLAPIGRLFPWSPIAMRLLSGIFALATIYIVREIARELKLGQTAQFIALGLMVLSPFQLHFAQEARMYALFQTLVLGATLAALRKQMLRFALLSALSLWTHNYGLFYLAMNCGVLSWVVWKTRPRSPVLETGMVVVIVGGASLALWAPWAGVLYHQMRIVEGGYWIMPVTFGSVIYALVNLMYAFTIPTWFAPTGIMLAAGLLTWLVIKTVQARDERAWLLLWLALSAPALAILVSFIWRPILLFRGLAPSLPAIFLLTGWAFARLTRLYRLYAALLIVPPLVAAIVGQYLYTPQQKSQEDQVYLQKLLTLWRPGDLIVYSNEGYWIEWKPNHIDHLPQIIMPRCPANNWGAISQQTRDAYGMVVRHPEMLRWERVWFVLTVFPTITQCEVDMARAFLGAHPHQRVFLIRGDEFVEASIWLVTR